MKISRRNLALVGLGSLVGVLSAVAWSYRKRIRIPSRVPFWPQSQDVYECCGFDSWDDPETGRRVKGCDVKLGEKTAHRIVEQLGVGDLEGVGNSPSMGTGLSREFCESHCPGGCDKGCTADIATIEPMVKS